MWEIVILLVLRAQVEQLLALDNLVVRIVEIQHVLDILERMEEIVEHPLWDIHVSQR